MPAFGQFLQGGPSSFTMPRTGLFLRLFWRSPLARVWSAAPYPALILSRFRPAPILRANDPGHTGSSLLRSVLVVLQFAVAIGLAIVTLVVFAQIDFVRNQSLGFRRDNILILDTNRRMTASARESFVAQLRSHPGILDVAMSGDVPFSGSELVAQMRLPGHPEYLTLHRQLITPEFFRLYNIQLVQGAHALQDAHGEDRGQSRFSPRQ